MFLDERVAADGLLLEAEASSAVAFPAIESIRSRRRPRGRARAAGAVGDQLAVAVPSLTRRRQPRRAAPAASRRRHREPGCRPGDHDTAPAEGVEMSGEGVGVHVQQRPSCRGRCRRRPGMAAGPVSVRRASWHIGASVRHADASEIDGAPVDGPVRWRRLGQAAGRVPRRQPDGGDARVQRRDQLGVDRPGEDGHDDVERRLVCDSQSLDLAFLETGGL